jgi:hypothetical protein
MDTTFRTKFHEPFHDLWGQVVGQEKYRKKDWQALDGLLWDAWEQRDDVRAATVLSLAGQLNAAQK